MLTLLLLKVLHSGSQALGHRPLPMFVSPAPRTPNFGNLIGRSGSVLFPENKAGRGGAERSPGPAAGLLAAETAFCRSVSFVTSQTILSAPSGCARISSADLRGRAVGLAGYCVFDTGNLGQVAALWVWPGHRSAGRAGGPALVAGRHF